MKSREDSFKWEYLGFATTGVPIDALNEEFCEPLRDSLHHLPQRLFTLQYKSMDGHLQISVEISGTAGGRTDNSTNSAVHSGPLQALAW